MSIFRTAIARERAVALETIVSSVEKSLSDHDEAFPKAESIYFLAIVIISGTGCLLAPFLQYQAMVAPLFLAKPWFCWTVLLPSQLSFFAPAIVAFSFFLDIKHFNDTHAQIVTERCKKLIMLTLGLHVYANLAVVLLLPRYPQILGLPVGSREHLVTTTTLMILVLYLSVALETNLAVVVIMGLQALQVFVRVYAGGESPTQAYLDLVQGLVLSAISLLFCTWLREYSRRTDKTVQASIHTQGVAFRLEGRIRAQREITALVHDHVIAALLLARPGSGASAEVIQQEAKRAIYVLSSHRNADNEQKTVRMLYHALQEQAAQIQTPMHQIDVEHNGDLSLTIPLEVWNALSLAAFEALRNVRRHAVADEQPVHCRVLVSVRKNFCQVIVRDDGVGFDMKNRRTDRMGVARSICERVESCDGGSVAIESSPGVGTEVVMRWEAPALALRTGGSTGPYKLEDYRSYTPLKKAVENKWVRRATEIFTFLVWTVGILQAKDYRSDWQVALGMCLFTLLVAALMQRTNGRAETRKIVVTYLISALMPVLVMSVWVGNDVIWVGSQGWPLLYGTIALLPLHFRGRSTTAVGMFLIMSASYCSGVVLSGSSLNGMQFKFVVAQAVTFFFTWYITWIVREIDQRLLAAQLRVEENMQSLLRREEEEKARTRLFGTINSYTLPLLVELSQLEPEDDDLRYRAIQLEARLRGLIRAPRLALNSAIASAADAARKRGAEVTLLDDFTTDGVGDWSDSLSPEIANQIADAIARVMMGEKILVRLCPAHALDMVTMQWTQSNGTAEFMEIPWSESVSNNTSTASALG